MRSHTWTMGLVLVLSSLLAGCGNKDSKEPAKADAGAVAPVDATAAPSGKLLVFIPCGMIIPFTDVVELFNESYPDVEVESSYDNGVVLVERVLKKGEKPDVFVSPGYTEVGRLAEKGLVDEASQITVAKFELVALVHKDKAAKLNIKKPEDLKKCKTISIPDPAINSVGAAGKEALTKLGLWDELEPKMVKTEHAIKSHEYVGNGQSDVGFSYDSCPLDTAPEKLSRMIVMPAFTFDKSLYRQQEVVVAPMKAAPNPAAAKAFIEFMDTTEARKILEKNGLNGCLKEGDDAGDLQEVIVNVTAFYPGNEGHAHVKEFIEGLNDKWDGKVRAEFVDFTGQDGKGGMKRWRKAGLSCGTVMINGEYSWSYVKDGKVRDVLFQMGMGGTWNEDDVVNVIEKILREKEAEAKTDAGDE